MHSCKSASHFLLRVCISMNVG